MPIAIGEGEAVPERIFVRDAGLIEAEVSVDRAQPRVLKVVPILVTTFSTAASAALHATLYSLLRLFILALVIVRPRVAASVIIATAVTAMTISSA